MKSVTGQSSRPFWKAVSRRQGVFLVLAVLGILMFLGAGSWILAAKSETWVFRTYWEFPGHWPVSHVLILVGLVLGVCGLICALWKKLEDYHHQWTILTSVLVGGALVAVALQTCSLQDALSTKQLEPVLDLYSSTAPEPSQREVDGESFLGLEWEFVAINSGEVPIWVPHIWVSLEQKERVFLLYAEQADQVHSEIGIPAPRQREAVEIASTTFRDIGFVVGPGESRRLGLFMYQVQVAITSPPRSGCLPEDGLYPCGSRGVPVDTKKDAFLRVSVAGQVGTALYDNSFTTSDRFKAAQDFDRAIVIFKS